MLGQWMSDDWPEADKVVIVDICRLDTALSVPLNDVRKVVFRCVGIVHLELQSGAFKRSLADEPVSPTKLNHTRLAVSRSAAEAQRDPKRALAMASVTSPVGSGPSLDIPMFWATCYWRGIRSKSRDQQKPSHLHCSSKKGPMTLTQIKSMPVLSNNAF